jgi:N-dimethylarginine dimethylaminohydrolase
LGAFREQYQLSNRCYHLDTCFCPLNNEAVLIYSGAYAAESLAALRPLWKRVHKLTADEAHKFMGNGIVANGRYFTSHITTHLESILCAEGLAPVVVEKLGIRKIRWQSVLYEGFPALKNI